MEVQPGIRGQISHEGDEAVDLFVLGAIVVGNREMEISKASGIGHLLLSLHDLRIAHASVRLDRLAGDVGELDGGGANEFGLLRSFVGEDLVVAHAQVRIVVLAEPAHRDPVDVQVRLLA